MINVLDNGNYQSYNEFMNILKNCQIVGTSFAPKQNKYTCLICCYSDKTSRYCVRAKN